MASESRRRLPDCRAVDRFSSKAAPTEAKLRGGYYTPDRLAKYVASWVAEAGPKLLEPSCGDGAILRHLDSRGASVLGIERDAVEATKAHETLISGEVLTEDFFTWLRPSQHDQWDGVAGNPPFIRFGNWPEKDRRLAMELLISVGLKPSRLTNSWVPFTVGSVLATRPGGRIGLVLPAELLQVTYAKQLRTFLLSHCEAIWVISFRKLVFEGILQEVVLLLAIRGQGPASVSTAEASDLGDLDDLVLPEAGLQAALNDREKWTKYFLSTDLLEAMRWARQDGKLAELKKFAKVDVGVVTGRNSFFTMTETEKRERGLDDHCVPLVSKSAQLAGMAFDEDDLAKQRANDARCWLLALDAESTGVQLDAYRQAGLEANVHEGYKCSIRKDWSVVPSVWTPDAFMLRQIHRHPRIVVNQTTATSTDTVHRVRLEPGTSAEKLATAAFNSATFAFAEVLGRSYGGGILELEPTESEALLIPSPALVPDDLPSAVDQLVRDSDLDGARKLVDQKILIDRLGWTEDQVSQLNQAWTILRDRRGGRGQRST
jgi:adenine-specific DNA methylase